MTGGSDRKEMVPGMPRLRIRGLFSWVISRLRNRPDSEHELTVNRIALSGTAFAYLIVAAMFGRADAAEMLREQWVYFAFYEIVSISLFLHLLHQPGVSVGRVRRRGWGAGRAGRRSGRRPQEASVSASSLRRANTTRAVPRPRKSAPPSR